MTTAIAPVNGTQNCFHKVQEKIWNGCSTQKKTHQMLILGRVLQAAALVSIVGAVTYAIAAASAAALIATIPAVALGALGIHLAKKPKEAHEDMQRMRPVQPGQPVGLANKGSDCWLNSSLQMLVNAPRLHHRMRQIPQFSQFLDAYAEAQNEHQKVAKKIDSQALRRFISRECGGWILPTHRQEDPADFFEYLFQGPNAMHQLSKQVDGGTPTPQQEPLLQIELGQQQSFQQHFNNYFNERSQDGQHIRLFFQRPPQDLFLKVRRFYGMTGEDGVFRQGKIFDLADTNGKLVLPHHFVRTGESATYACDSFSVHQGATQNQGHYISYVKMGGKWWYCSDKTVYEVSENLALRAMKKGYFFHFSRT